MYLLPVMSEMALSPKLPAVGSSMYVGSYHCHSTDGARASQAFAECFRTYPTAVHPLEVPAKVNP